MALGVFVLALLVYALTLAPDITWAHDGGDGGDLITAAVTGGVPHPPGYPTYLLLATPLARLPWGNPAWRLNLLSALGAAGAAGLTTLAVAQLATDGGHSARVAHAAGAGAGLALAFSPVLWSQAVIAEVYALEALFAALLVFLAVRCPLESSLQAELPAKALTPERRTNRGETLPKKRSAAVTFGVAMGLAMGAQPLLILFGLTAPVVLERRWKNWAWAGSGFLIGLTVFLVLPIRARNNAPVNWGDAATLDGLWWLVSAQLYRGFVFALPITSLGMRLAAWAAMVARQFTPVGALTGVWGLWQLWRSQRSLALTMLAMFAGFSIFAIGYNTTDSYVHLIPAFILLAVWLGVGLAEILGKLKDRTGLLDLSGLEWSAALALPLAVLVIGWPAADLHTDRAAVAFGQTMLDQAPARAILLTEQDAHTFTLWYFHYARGQRPDVTIVDRDLLALPWYRAALARESDLRYSDSVSDPLAALAALGRPMCRVSASLECRQK